MTIETVLTTVPVLTLNPGSPAPRVAVVTGSYGAGHDSAAREIARALDAAGCHVEIHDVVPLLPWRLGPLLRAAYFAQLRRRPSSWGTTLRLLEPGRGAHRLVTRLLRWAVAPVLAAVRGCDLVITTHPFGAQALGHARLSGRLSAPAVTYLTDASVHALWVHPGIDLNLAIHEVAAAEARRWGGRAEVVKPLVELPAPAVPLPGVDDPTKLDGVDGPWVLVTGGSHGIGELEATARDVVAAGRVTPVVLCGNDDRLRRRLSRLPGVVALGWRDDVPALMTHSDCVVQNAGGFTSLEALASGTPVITYRPVPGHGVSNAVNLEKAGLVPWARNRDDLALLLAAAGGAPRRSRLPVDAPDLLDVLTGRPTRLVAA